MPPKPRDTELAEQVLPDVTRIAALEQSVARMSILEYAMMTMHQQMHIQTSKMGILDRLEQRLNEEEEETKRRRLESDKGKKQQTWETSFGEEFVGGGSPPGGKKSQVDPPPKNSGFREESSGEKTSSSKRRSHRDDDDWEWNRPLTRRLEIPTFDGENAESWVLRVEQYFEISDFTEEEKLKAVRMCFVDDALLWYRWERDRNPFQSWEQMKVRIIEQYSMSQDTTTAERLLMLRQEGSVKDFCRDFVSLAANSLELTESVLEMAFMIGLKPKIKTGVKMFEPKSLKRMMSLAKMVEEWSNPEETSATNTSGTGSRSTKSSNDRAGNQISGNGPVSQKPKPNNFSSNLGENSTTTSRGQTQRNPQNHNRVKPLYRRLTPAEVARWKAEGLCFKCDEKYHANHRCPKKELTVLIIQEDGSETECLEEPCEVEAECFEAEAEVAELSMNSVVGMSSPRTMKVKGTIQGVEVIVLIDSGASHKFISEKLALKLGMESVSTMSYGILVAGGVTMKGKGVISGVELSFQGCTIVKSFLPLELGIADVILGVQWLNTLGEMRVNWRLQQMKIKVDGEWVQLLEGNKLL